MIKCLVHEKGKNFVKITLKKRKERKRSFITQDKNVDVITTAKLEILLKINVATVTPPKNCKHFTELTLLLRGKQQLRLF